MFSFVLSLGAHASPPVGESVSASSASSSPAAVACVGVSSVVVVVVVVAVVCVTGIASVTRVSSIATVVAGVVVVASVVVIVVVVAGVSLLLRESVRRRIRGLDAFDHSGADLSVALPGLCESLDCGGEVGDVLLDLRLDVVERLEGLDVPRRVLGGRRVSLLHGEAAAESGCVAASHGADVAG